MLCPRRLQIRVFRWSRCPMNIKVTEAPGHRPSPEIPSRRHSRILCHWGIEECPTLMPATMQLATEWKFWHKSSLGPVSPGGQTVAPFVIRWIILWPVWFQLVWARKWTSLFGCYWSPSAELLWYGNQERVPGWERFSTRRPSRRLASFVSYFFKRKLASYTKFR